MESTTPVQTPPAAESPVHDCLDRLSEPGTNLRPLSTYRLQFNQQFGFERALRLLPYLEKLGISDIYSSPILQARAGSPHGYDIADHNRLNAEMGSGEDFANLVAEMRQRGMGMVLDFVPNHMGVGQGTNPWWQDVLENGRTAEHADFFDIEWNPLETDLQDKVLLPVLANPYGEELETENLRLTFADGKFRFEYFDKRLPIDPQTIPLLFESFRPAMRGSEFERLLDRLAELPKNNEPDQERVQRRRQQIPGMLKELAELARRSPEVESAIESALIRANEISARGADLRHHLLDAQAYRLAHWLVSGEEINYRRFFDINDLVGIKMENPQVFAATHGLLRRLLAEGAVTGVRLDHVDGLFNPRQYLIRLQMLYAAAQCHGPEPRGPVAENGIEEEMQLAFGLHGRVLQQPPLYCVVEKILERGEHLRKEWPVHGTSGYDFVNLVNGIFIDRRNEKAFTTLYERFTESRHELSELVYESKKLILHTALASEVAVLTALLDRISSEDRWARDYTRKALRMVIRETIACFPVYRTYIDERGEVSEHDRQVIGRAILHAKRRNEGVPAKIFDFLRGTLLLQSQNVDEERYRRELYFTLKFQQLTGPVMAKGLEDTVFYRYNRFVSTNEVGGDPEEFGLDVNEFHAGNLERVAEWPYSMLATSTHDTKRSEDVRARLNVLSEMPRAWSAAVHRWRRMNQKHRKQLGDERIAPDRNEEYLLYQTLVGAWPWPGEEQEMAGFIGRIQGYMSKALHEAKVNLSWINPNPEYTGAVMEFVEHSLGPARRRNFFFEDLERFVAPVALFGAINSLAQKMLTIGAPGVPDIYRGSELWDFSLVDPDNRRPVDYGIREQMVDELLARAATGDQIALCEELMRTYQDGRIKLWTTMQALRVRRDNRRLFAEGRYSPVFGAVEKEEHLCAYARHNDSGLALVAAPRLAYTLMRGRTEMPVGEAWGRAELRLPAGAPGRFRNVLTGEELQALPDGSLLCREVFAHFPVALLLGG